jgi:hypothetical protein
MEEKFD